MYTEVSSFQGIGIEGFHSIQKCPHIRFYDIILQEMSLTPLSIT